MTDNVSIRMKTQTGQPIDHDFVHFVPIGDGVLIGFTELGTVYGGKLLQQTQSGKPRIEWVELENIDKS